jgi:aminoglycoside 6'-N-acetyltransferase I
MEIVIEPLRDAADERWLALRRALWPHCDDVEHRAEMAAQAADADRWVQCLARDRDGRAVGLAEAALRRDYVNGTDHSPVAFLEGVFVVPDARRRGVARALVAWVECWGRDRGCRELASDALLDNGASHAMHRALGFAETERVVFFRKPLE